VSGPEEQTIERVAKAMWDVENTGVTMSWVDAVRFERMAQAAVSAMPDTTAKARNE